MFTSMLRRFADGATFGWRLLLVMCPKRCIHGWWRAWRTVYRSLISTFINLIQFDKKIKFVQTILKNKREPAWNCSKKNLIPIIDEKNVNLLSDELLRIFGNSFPLLIGEVEISALDLGVETIIGEPVFFFCRNCWLKFENADQTWTYLLNWAHPFFQYLTMWLSIPKYFRQRQ